MTNPKPVRFRDKPAGAAVVIGLAIAVPLGGAVAIEMMQPATRAIVINGVVLLAMLAATLGAGAAAVVTFRARRTGLGILYVVMTLMSALLSLAAFGWLLQSLGR